jgi:hypothetical protein
MIWQFYFNEHKKRWAVLLDTIEGEILEQFFLEDKYEAMALCAKLNHYYLTEIDFSKLSRITVVDRTQKDAWKQRAFEKWNVKVGCAVQDGGRTLKLFLDKS